MKQPAESDAEKTCLGWSTLVGRRFTTLKRRTDHAERVRSNQVILERRLREAWPNPNLPVSAPADASRKLTNPEGQR